MCLYHTELYCPTPLSSFTFTFLFPLCSTFLQVKTLSEEATNRKALIESLKRRLSVATTEKSQYEASCTKLKEDLEKKVANSHAYSSLELHHIEHFYCCRHFYFCPEQFDSTLSSESQANFNYRPV